MTIPPILYHGMRSPAQGDMLRTGHTRLVNGVTGSYLFATPYLSKVMMFAFDWHAHEAIWGGAIPDTNDQFIVICRGQETLNKPRSLYVYALPSEGFEKCVSGSAFAPNVTDTREYFSRDAVPLSQVNLAFEISDTDTLMHHGLQVFSTEQSYQDLEDAGFIEQARSWTGQEPSIISLSRNFMLRWENQERGINVNPVLCQLITG